MATELPDYGHNIARLWTHYRQIMDTLSPAYGHIIARLWPQYRHPKTSRHCREPQHRLFLLFSIPPPGLQEKKIMRGDV